MKINRNILNEAFVTNQIKFFIGLSIGYTMFGFIGGGHRGSRRKPPTCSKSLTNFIT